MTPNDAATTGIACPHCHARYQVAISHLGRPATCQRCGESFIASSASAGENDQAYRLLEGVDQPAANSVHAHQSYLSIRCPLCRTLIRAPESKIGEQIKCPDCYKMVDITPPSEPKESAPVERTPAGPEYRLLDGVDQPDAASQIAHQEYLSFKCPVCLAHIRAAAQQAGACIPCPDCGEPVVAPQPPAKPQQRSPYANRARPDERMSPLRLDTVADYAVSPTHEPEPSKIVPQASRRAQKVEEDVAGSDDAVTTAIVCSHCHEPYRVSPTHLGRSATCKRCGEVFVVAAAADSAKEKENAEENNAAKAEGKRRKKKRRPFSPNVVTFFRQGAVAIRWLTFTLAQIFGLILVGKIFSLDSEGGAETTIALIALLAILFGVEGMWLVLISANLVALVRETSAGVDVLKEWTGAMFLDWIGDILFVLVALAASVLPGFLVCRILNAGNLVTWAYVAPWMIWLIFPPFFLAALDAGAPFTPISTTVYRSLGVRKLAWLRFYVASGLLWSGGAGLVYAVLTSLPPFGILAMFLNASVFVGVLLLYFRWMGILAHAFAEVDVRSQDAS